MNIDDLLQSLPSKEDITNALSSRYNNTNFTGSSQSADVMPALGIFATGMLLGAGLALLFAPKSGSQIRRDIAERVNEFGGQAREYAEEVGGQARQYASEIGEQGRQMAGQISGQQSGRDQHSSQTGSSQQTGTSQTGRSTSHIGGTGTGSGGTGSRS